MKIMGNKSESMETRARGLYNTIRNPVRCKCLNQDVYFNAQGFHHLLYDGSGHARPIEEKGHKLSLIPLVVPVILIAANSTYRKSFEQINRKKNSSIKQVEYWGLEGSVGKKKIKIKVVLKRVGAGQIIFWSVMRLRSSKNTR